MSDLTGSAPPAQDSLAKRSQQLRKRSATALDRASTARARGMRLLGTGGQVERERQQPPVVRIVRDDRTQPPPPEPHSAESAELDEWFRGELERMLASGWSREELADVGITESALAEYGLSFPDA